MLNSSQIQIDCQLYWVPTVNIASLKNCLQGCKFHPVNAEWFVKVQLRGRWHLTKLMFPASTMFGLGKGKEMFAFIKSCWKESRHILIVRNPLVKDDCGIITSICTLLRMVGFCIGGLAFYSSKKLTKSGTLGQLIQRVLRRIWGFGFQASSEWCGLKMERPMTDCIATNIANDTLTTSKVSASTRI